MFIWTLLLGGASAPHVNPTYTLGILHPIVDTSGDFSINDDADTGEIRDLSTALNPVD